MQWFRNTLIKGILCSSAVAVFSGHLLAADIDTAKSDANSAGAAVQSRYGSPDALNKNLNIPMTNSSTQMTTVDGSKSFGAALGIPSSNKFLEIMIQPSATGDLTNVIVAQDLDANGVFDHTFNIGMPVSGVCSNGFISCSPGTWNSCLAYKWASDVSGNLSVVPADSITRLAGCSCINSSCGSNLAWSNSGIILQALGGGAVASIRVQDATTTITDVATDPVTITYYGQLVRNAESSASTVPATSSLAGPQTQQKYYTDWPGLEDAKSNISLTQSTDPNSLYYQLTNSAASTNAEVRRCNVTRVESVVPRDRLLGYRVKVYLGWDADGANKECYWGLDGQCIAAFARTSSWDQCRSLFYNKMGDVIQGLYGVSYTCQTIKEDSVTSASGPRCYGSDGSDPIAFFNIRCYQSSPEQGEVEIEEYPELRGKKDFVGETINDGCSTIESDSKCKLRGETIDGVITVRDYAATGLNQLPTCRTFDGVMGPLDICKPWWQKQREYVCTTTPPTFDLTRYKTVKETTVRTGTSFSFKDYRQGSDGSWSTFDSSGILPPGDAYDTCMPTCKVKRPVKRTETSVFGSVETKMVDNSSFETHYLACNADNVCPTEAGDQIVNPCGCLDEFSQAASIMQSMRLSGADSICSTGTPLPP